LWRFLCDSSEADSSEALSLEAFCYAIKKLGTGIQLTADDVAIAFESEDNLTFERFAAFCA
jgi:hypothetical protein